jgi:hypothetical protein
MDLHLYDNERHNTTHHNKITKTHAKNGGEAWKHLLELSSESPWICTLVWLSDSCFIPTWARPQS